MSSPRPSTATVSLRTNTPDADRVVSLLPSSDPDGVAVPRYFHQVYQYEAAAPPMRRYPQQQGLPSHRYPSDRGPATDYQAARISSRPYDAMPAGPGRFWSAGAHYGSPGHSGTRPRRQRGRCFVTAVSLFMSFEYCAYVSAVLPSILYPRPSAWSMIYTFLFHILFTLAIISFVQTSVVDPGVVPANWGFYMGDDCKRRRYCKVCHVWKPDRTHHCSACGRCVLNMDHHCPWVSNCIGFENRKFFIQFLCYGLLCVTCLVVHGSYFVITQGSELVPHTSLPADPGEMLGYILNVSRFGTAVIMLLLAIMLEVPLIPFTKFHLTMITRNSTTIENMDSLSRDRARYDLGVMRNLEQVLGPTISLWWLPFHTRASRPVGDGVRWRQQYWKALEGADI